MQYSELNCKSPSNTMMRCQCRVFSALLGECSCPKLEVRPSNIQLLGKDIHEAPTCSNNSHLSWNFLEFLFPQRLLTPWEKNGVRGIFILGQTWAAVQVYQQGRVLRVHPWRGRATKNRQKKQRPYNLSETDLVRTIDPMIPSPGEMF